jgi:hypothetical protein
MWYVWGGEKKCVGFWCGYLRERDHLEDLGIDGRVIVKSVLKESVGKWIYLAQERDRWRTCANAVMNLGVPRTAGIFGLPEDLFASQEGLCSMELVS